MSKSKKAKSRKARTVTIPADIHPDQLVIMVPECMSEAMGTKPGIFGLNMQECEKERNEAMQFINMAHRHLEYVFAVRVAKRSNRSGSNRARLTFGDVLAQAQKAE